MKTAPGGKAPLTGDNAWSRLGESNPGPTHYECVALPSELRRRVHCAGLAGHDRQLYPAA
jgi:hypothetical protein